MRPASAAIVLRPESHDEVRRVAAELLRRAHAIGVFPTPLEQLVAAGGVREVKSIDADCASFIKEAAAHVRAAFASAIAKIRGFADLVGGRTFAAPDATEVQKRWVRLHELGHQVIPWQNIRPGYIDDKFSLSPECEDIFDREANDFASELLFQGERFPPLAKRSGNTMDSVFNYANKYRASKWATTRRFAEEAREAALLITYHRSSYALDENGFPELWLGRRGHSASPKFLQRYTNLALPQSLVATDPWALARPSGLVQTGQRSFDCGDGTRETFQWEAWWNQYALLVLLWKAQGFRLIRLP